MAYPDPYKPSDVKREGNSYSGMNVTGDNISINGQTPGGGFMVSGGLAARAMAQQSSASQRSPVGMTVEQAQQQGLIGERVGYNPAYDQRINQSGEGGGLAARALTQAAMQQREPYNPNVGSSSQWMGDLRDPRNLALRNASVGSTIFRNKGEEMMANKARQARIAGVQAAIGSQMKGAQEADTERYQSDNTLAGNLGAEQMRQDGENQRSARSLAVDQQRLGIDAGKAAQESTARGFDIRAAQRREGILQRYDAAKTDQERVQMQRQYPDVFGREKNAQENLSNNFMRRKVPVLDEQGRPTGTEREEIVDLRTGLALGGNPSGPPAPKSKAEYDALPKGAQYIKDGKVLVKS